MLHNTMYSVYNELSLSRDNNDQVTSRHHATYRTHNSSDRRQATRDSGGPSQQAMAWCSLATSNTVQNIIVNTNR